jgi:adenosine/AMP kinase
MELIIVKIDAPHETNLILGQTHFIKSVEDLYEALITSVPGIKFGLAFCEASANCLVRSDGNDEEHAGSMQHILRHCEPGRSYHCRNCTLGKDSFAQ